MYTPGAVSAMMSEQCPPILKHFLLEASLVLVCS